MTLVRRLLLLYMLCLGVATQMLAQTLVTTQATRAHDFTESVGVNTHFGYEGNVYWNNVPFMIAEMQKLGVLHIRDGYSAPPFSGIIPIHVQLANAGVKADLVIANPAANHTVATLDASASMYPDLELFESPNEFDNNGDSNWVADLTAYLPTLKQVSVDTGIPLLGPSLTQTASYAQLGDVSQYASLGNYHAYYGNRNPDTYYGWGPEDAAGNWYASMAWGLEHAAIIDPGLPTMFTETGFVAGTTRTTTYITEADEAIYEPRLLLHAWNAGVKRSYVYELIDDSSSPVGFGLLRANLTERPAFTALASLMSILHEPSATSFTPGALTYTLTGYTSGMERMVVQKADGSYFLAIWLADQIYDVNTLAQTEASPQTVTIAAPAGKVVANQWAFDNTGSTTQTSPATNAVTVSINSAVTILQISAPTVVLAGYPIAGAAVVSGSSVLH